MRSALEQSWPPFVLIAGLLLIGLVANRDGLFAWGGARLESLPGGALALLGAALLLDAVVTAVLNLDTAVVFLTPVLVYAARRRRVAVEPFLYGCVFMANASSLFLPGSNLTNLLVLGAGDGTAGASFAAKMFPLALTAALVTAAGVAVLFRRDFAAVAPRLAEPSLADAEGRLDARGPTRADGPGAAAIAADQASSPTPEGADPAGADKTDSTSTGGVDPTLEGADPVGAGRAEPTGVERSGRRATADAPVVVGTGLLATAAAVVLVLVLRKPQDVALTVLAVAVAATAVELARSRIAPADVRRVVGPLSLAAAFVLTVALGTLARHWNGPAELIDGASGPETAGLAALSTVLVNNLPSAALYSAHAVDYSRMLLLGLNVGPNLAVTGALSALLWFRSANEVDARPSLLEFSRRGVPLALLATGAAIVVGMLT